MCVGWGVLVGEREHRMRRASRWRDCWGVDKMHQPIESVDPIFVIVGAVGGVEWLRLPPREPVGAMHGAGDVY